MFFLLLCVSGALSYHHSGHFHPPPQSPSQNWYPATYTGNNGYGRGHPGYQGHQVSSGYHSNYQSSHQFGQPYLSPNHQDSDDRTVYNGSIYETNNSNHQVDDNIHYEYPRQQHFDKFEPKGDNNKSSQSENGQDNLEPSQLENSQDDTHHAGQYNTHDPSQPGNDNNNQKSSKLGNDSNNSHDRSQPGHDSGTTHDLGQLGNGQNDVYISSLFKNVRNSTHDLIQSGSGHNKGNANEQILSRKDKNIQNDTHKSNENRQDYTHDSSQVKKYQDNTNEPSQMGYDHYEYPWQQHLDKFEPDSDNNKPSQSENGQNNHEPSQLGNSQNDTHHAVQYNNYDPSQPGNDNNNQESSKSRNNSDNSHDRSQPGNESGNTHVLGQLGSGQNNVYISSPLKNVRNSTHDPIQSGSGHDKGNANEQILLGKDQNIPNNTHKSNGNRQNDTHDSSLMKKYQDTRKTHEPSRTGYGQNNIYKVIHMWNNKDTKDELSQDDAYNDTMPIPTNPTAPPVRPTAEPGPGSEPVPTLGELYAPAFQWHVGVYTKTFTPYMQICGGSLVKADVVISAAHCFWNDDVGLLRPALFAVAAGKLLRPWEISRESFAQYSDVKHINIPPRFQGGKTSFQDDIAVVIMTSPFEYAPGVKPVCVSFDLELDRQQLKTGSKGTIAGWGLTLPNGPPSQRLNFLKLPYMDIAECVRSAEPSFLKFITSDKICAGDHKTGRALCRGDSGGGLVYYTDAVPYLRGVASTAQRETNECNACTIKSFTHVLAHRTFLVDHVPDIAEGCEALYHNGTRIKDTSVPALLTGTSQQSPQENSTNSAHDLLEQNEDEVFNIGKDEKSLEDQNNKEQTSEQVGVIKVTNRESTKLYGKQESMKMNVTNEEANPEVSSLNSCTQSRGQGKVATIETKELTSVVTSSQDQDVQSDDQFKATVNVWSGDRVMTVPVKDGASTFVCNCFRKD